MVVEFCGRRDGGGSVLCEFTPVRGGGLQGTRGGAGGGAGRRTGGKAGPRRAEGQAAVTFR
jgi:hypothetical protein